MKNLYMLTGLPRSGKTTLRKILVAIDPHLVVVSADDLRLKVYGQQFFLEGEQYLWATHDVMFKALLDQGHDIILDNINITSKTRQKYNSFAKDRDYVCHSLRIVTEYDICIERIKDTPEPYRTGLLKSMERFSKDYTPPYYEDGFNYLTTWGGADIANITDKRIKSFLKERSVYNGYGRSKI